MILTIYGEPKPQGSKSAFRQGNRIVMVEASKGLPEWRKQVITACNLYKLEQMTVEPFTSPVRVTAVFVLSKPKKPKFSQPGVKPDLDKLVRGLLDPIVIAEILKDDSLVTEIIASKVYIGDTRGLPEPGCRVIIEKITDS